MKKLIAGLSLVVMAALEGQNGAGYCNPCCDPCGYGTFSAGADWLFWKTEQSQMVFAFSDYEVETTSAGGTNVSDTTENLSPHFKYNSGYRIFVDHIGCDCRWRASISYTHLPSSARRDFTGFENSGLTTLTRQFALLNPLNFTQFQLSNLELGVILFQQLSTRWRSTFNYLDFDLARVFNPCNCLEIVPNLGVRALWVRQSFALDAPAALPINSLTAASLSSRMSGKINSAGLEGGLNIAWRFYNNFSLESHIGAALLYGHLHTKGKSVESITFASTFVETDTLTNQESFHRGLAMFDLFIGVAYDNCLCGWPYEIHFGWEEHLLLNSNLFSTNSLGSTNLQGFTLGGSIAF